MKWQRADLIQSAWRDVLRHYGTPDQWRMPFIRIPLRSITATVRPCTEANTYEPIGFDFLEFRSRTENVDHLVKHEMVICEGLIVHIRPIFEA